MDSVSKKNPGKMNVIKTVFVLCFAAALVFVLMACKNDQEAVKIEIKAPSAGESTIAPGRHFKVSGLLSGEIPDDASLRVTLLDAEGNELRYAETNQKGTDHIIPSVTGGDITVFNKDTDFSEVAYTAPEFAVADMDDPDASAHDATVKCVYTDKDFYALIVSSTDPEHGLTEADGYELVDHEGKPYEALPEGKYTIRVEMSSADGKELASSSLGICFLVFSARSTRCRHCRCLFRVRQLSTCRVRSKCSFTATCPQARHMRLRWPGTCSLNTT